MKILAPTLITLALGAPAVAQGTTPISKSLQGASALSMAEIQSVSPALARYGQQHVVGALWERPQLSPRDRSLVTVAILVARHHPVDLAHYLSVVLDNGVTPRELSETVTHLAFYAGWSNAMSAVFVARDVFAQRGIGADPLPAASPELRPVDEPGDVVGIPDGIKHRHGGTDTNAMSHIAVTYVQDGENVDWMELVTDEQYAVR